MKSIWMAVVLFCSVCWVAAASPVIVTSPDGQVVFKLDAGTQGPVFSISLDGQELMKDSSLGLLPRGAAALGPNLLVIGSKTTAHDETYKPVWGTASSIRDHCQLAEIELAEGGGAGRTLGLLVRAYDDGIAFRYRVPGDGAAVEIDEEQTAFRLTEDAKVFAMPVANFRSSYEGKYHIGPFSSLGANKLIGLPVTVEFSNHKWAAITEADLNHYAGLYLSTGVAPAATAPATGMDSRPEPRTFYTRLSARGKDAPVQAKTPFNSPWRVILLGRRPGDLVESNLVFNCNPPCAIADPSWIKPGKVIWDWWPKQMVNGVDFAGGINTATMKHYAKFAGESGLEYLLIDEGWSWWANIPDKNGKMQRVTDITRTVPDINLPEILAYSRQHNVRVWLWLTWSHCAAQMAEAFPLYEKWGVAGVKIDFMCRDDQWMVDWYHEVVQLAAKHHLMVDLHGAYKPEGMERTWPNLLTREAVLGLENAKWSKDVTPEHNVTLPFTRMLAGPMDYTPGGFNVSTPDRFKPRDSAPFVMGTRCHQLAQYVAFFSPLQMCVDYPDNYRGAIGFEFLRWAPTTWDRTVVIEGSPGESIAIARQHGDTWYLGCMTNSKPRKLTIPLKSFLGPGRWRADIFADGERAAEVPEQIRRSRRVYDADANLEVAMVPAGGYAARFLPDDGTPDSGRTIRHLIAFALKPTLTADQKQELLAATDALPGRISEIAGYERGPDVSGRGLNHGLEQAALFTFRSKADLNIYINHPVHKAFVEKYKAWMVDLLVFDWEGPE
jgi:alpha-glucosidase